jgi:hypothetical protein
MARRERFETRGLWIETGVDWSGRYWIAYRPSVSMFFRDRKALTKWAGYPAKTATRDSLFSWLDSLEASDIQRKAPIVEQDDALLKATGFGPECHDVDSDNTRMIRCRG